MLCDDGSYDNISYRMRDRSNHAEDIEDRSMTGYRISNLPEDGKGKGRADGSLIRLKRRYLRTVTFFPFRSNSVVQ